VLRKNGRGQLRASAAGIYPTEAGTGLLISHDTWLHRDDFTAAFVHTGTSITDGTTKMAEVDWPAAIQPRRRDTREPPRHPDRHRRPQHRTSDHRDLACLGTTAITADSMIIS
jgi:hypothetical protein